MKARSKGFEHTLAAAMNSEGENIVIGEVRGCNAELVERLIVPSTWTFDHAEKSFGIVERLKSKIITDNK